MHPDPLYVVLVDDINKAWRFYVYIVGCTLVKATDSELNLKFYGNRLSVRLGASGAGVVEVATSECIQLGVNDWCSLSERLRERKVDFAIETGSRFNVSPGEQCSINFTDPAGNLIRINGFASDDNVLAA